LKIRMGGSLEKKRMSEPILGGGFMIARKIFRSGIWSKHPLYLKVWIWIVGRASHSDHEKGGHIYPRGEFVTTHKEIIKTCEYRLNKKRIIPTLKQIRVILEWLQTEGMITLEPILQGHTIRAEVGAYPQESTRAYLGIKIVVVNYDTYQSLEFYRGTPQGGNKGRHRGIPQGHYNNNGFNKNGIKRTPDEISSEISLLTDSLFPSTEGKELFTRTIEAISTTRKTKKISPSVILRFVQQLEPFSQSRIMSGMRIFLEKEYYRQGKNEKYLLGILRNINLETPQTPEFKSTGSHLLDAYNRGKTPSVRVNS
jgi:hypothetical protein